MVKGIGVDVVPVDGFKKRLERTPRLKDRLFTNEEMELSYSVESLAGRFAAKEAVLKALGIGLSHGARWRDVEILGGIRVPPYVVLHGKLKEMAKGLDLFISISHAGGVAVGVCVAVSSDTC